MNSGAGAGLSARGRAELVLQAPARQPQRENNMSLQSILMVAILALILWLAWAEGPETERPDGADDDFA